MPRVGVDSFEFHLKFALRNLKSAILLGALRARSGAVADAKENVIGTFYLS
jgi:hypothetical protein